MKLKLGSIGYVPPPNHPKLGKCAQSFVLNMEKFKPTYSQLLYSDYIEYGFKPIANPEGIGGQDRNPKWAVNNAIFISGIRLAVIAGFTHIIYLEADCRVGTPGWDAVIFDEYFRLPFPAVAAGSLVSHGCVNGGQEFFRRFSDMIAMNRRDKSQHLIPIYGVPCPPEKQGQFPSSPSPNIIPPGDARTSFKPAVYPNGALGVYDVAWLAELFGIQRDGKFKDGYSTMDVVLGVAWDHLIGMKLYDRFGVDLFDVVAHMDSVYSGFGDRLDTEADRLKLLTDKRAVAVHQVKSGATI